MRKYIKLKFKFDKFLTVYFLIIAEKQKKNVQWPPPEEEETVFSLSLSREYYSPLAPRKGSLPNAWNERRGSEQLPEPLFITSNRVKSVVWPPPNYQRGPFVKQSSLPPDLNRYKQSDKTEDYIDFSHVNRVPQTYRTPPETQFAHPINCHYDTD